MASETSSEVMSVASLTEAVVVAIAATPAMEMTTNPVTTTEEIEEEEDKEGNVK